MKIAVIDELGHTGAYVSRDHAQHSASPIAGYGGFVIPVECARPFAQDAIGLKQHVLNCSRTRAVRRELKANEIFRPGLFDPNRTSRVVRKNTNRLAHKLADYLAGYGGKTFFFAKEKHALPENHDARAFDRGCLREAIEIMKDEAKRTNEPWIIVIDRHRDHSEKTRLIAFAMSENGYFASLAEPPLSADSELSISVQIADWISGILNKVFIHTSSKAAEWPECAEYYARFHAAFTSHAVPGSRFA